MLTSMEVTTEIIDIGTGIDYSFHHIVLMISTMDYLIVGCIICTHTRLSMSADSRSASHHIKGCTPNTAYTVSRKCIIAHRVSITVMLIVTSIIICDCVPFIVLPTNIAIIIIGGYAITVLLLKERVY